MASSDEAKVKISADISSFNSAISSAKSTVTELNSALKLVQAQMNTNGTSTDQLQQKLNTLKEKSSALKSEEDALKQKLDATVEAYGENSSEAQRLQTQLNNVQTKEAQVEQEINQTNQAIEEQQKAEEQAQSASGQLVTTINQQERELEALKQQYTNVVLEEGKDSEAAQELAGKITTLNSDLQDNKQKLADAEQAADDLTKSEEELGDEGEDAGNKMSEGFQTAYEALAAAGLIEAMKKLSAALKECIDAAAGFESQMSTVKALSGATGDEMEQLSAKAKEMGATTSFTATEAGEAMEYMALAGWSADEMMDGLGGVINLAAAAGEDLGTTCDIVTDALTAFGMEASDTAHFTDVLAAASTSSNTTVSQMGEAFKQVATTAGTLGYSIDDVSVALGLMADNGIKGSSAGTTLATALTRMSGTNASATAELEKLNVSMFDSQGETKDLATFLDELRTALKENCTTDAEMQTALYNLAGQRGMKGLAAIVNTTDEDFAALTNSIDTCEGSAEEMADIKLDNFQGAVTLLSSAFDGLKTTIGEAALPALTSFVEVLTNIITGVNDFLTAHEGARAAVIAITVAVVAFTAAIVACSVGMKTLQKAIDAITTSLEANPFGLAVAGITALVAGITTLVAVMRNADTETNNLRKETKALTEEVKEQQEAYDELCEANEDTATSYTALTKELEALLQKTDKEASDYTRINSIVSELNDGLLDNALAYDSETDSINMTTEALEEIVEAQNEATANDAAIERQSELYDEQTRITEELARAEADRDEVLASVTATEDMSASSLMASAGAAEYAGTQTMQYERRIKELQQDLDSVNADLEDVNAEINEYAAATEVAANTTNYQITEAVEELGDTLIGLQTAYSDAYDAAYESMSGQFDLWEQASEVAITSMDDLQAALDSQQEYWEQLADNIELLSNSGIEGMDALLASIDTTSQDGVNYIASLAAGIEDSSFDMQAYVDQATEGMSGSWQQTAASVANSTTDYTNAVETAMQECIECIEDLDGSDAARQAAYDTLAGYVTGLDEESGEVTDETQTIAEDILEKFAEELGVSSPSWKTEADGVDTIEGFVKGADSKGGDAESTLTDIAKTSLNAFDSLANGTALVGTGQDTVTGFKSGANSQKSAASTEMKGIAQNALTSFKNISTNSALTSSGQDSINGYITGTNNKLSLLTSSMMSHAKSALQNFTNLATSSALYSAGANTIQGAINGANSKGTNFTSTLANIANNALSKFKSTLGVSSPSWIAEETLEDFDEGAVIGAENGADGLNEAMVEVAGGAMESFNGAMQAPEMDFGNVVNMYDYLAGRLGSLSTDIQMSMNIDYDRLAESMSKYNMTVSIGEREFGRVVREVI